MLLTQRPITYGTQKPTLPLRTRPAKGSITEHLSVALSAEEASTGPITFVAFKSGQTRIQTWVLQLVLGCLTTRLPDLSSSCLWHEFYSDSIWVVKTYKKQISSLHLSVILRPDSLR